MRAEQVNSDNLNTVLDFDHVVAVLPDGRVIEGPGGLYAPDLLDGEVSGTHAWELLDGYSGQHGYRGPVMHPSEYIGGRMADDILATPGIYVAVVAYYSADEDAERDEDPTVDGWAVARLAPAMLACRVVTTPERSGVGIACDSNVAGILADLAAGRHVTVTGPSSVVIVDGGE